MNDAASALEQDASRERESVAVQPARGQGDQRVARAHRASVDQASALDDADREDRQVVLPIGIEGWHLGCFATDEAAPGHATAALDAV